LSSGRLTLRGVSAAEVDFPSKHPEYRNELEDVAAERTVTEITETDKYQFLQMIRQGLNRQEAANSLDFKGRHFRAICSPQSNHYDEDFARSYAEAIGSLEFAEGRLERLRAEGFRRAMLDSDRILIKLLEVYDPDWEKLRQKDVNVNVNVLIERVFDKLSTEQLEQLQRWLDDGHSIEDADFIELGLPAGGTDE
jgi:hypothetical protein